jgi:hypothetical protein
MSILKLNSVQIGQSATTTNNFTLYQPAVPDGTIRLGNGNNGSDTERLRIGANGNVLLNSTTTPMAGSKMLIKNDASNLSALTLWNATGGANTYVDLTASTYSNHTTSWPATIRFTDNGSFSNHISFRTKNAGNAANADAERMKILSSGQVQFPFQPCCEVSRNLGGETLASGTNYGVGSTFGVNRGGFYNGGTIGGGGVVLHVPVDGYYKITLNVYSQEGIVGKRLTVMTSAGTGAAMIHFIAGTFTYSSTGVVNMTAGQYLYLANSSYGTLSCYTALAHTYITVEYLG